MAHVICPKCTHKLDVPDSANTLRVRCRKCSHVFLYSDKDEYARYKARQAKLKSGEEVFGHRERRDDYKEWAKQPKVVEVKAVKVEKAKKTLLEEFRSIKKVVRKPEEDDEDE